MKSAPRAILKVNNLHVDFMQDDDIVHAVKGVSFELFQGECLAIVGESGSGKSVSAMSFLQLHDPAKTRFLGEAWFQSSEGKVDLLEADEKTIEAISGRDIALVFQEPMSAFNPTVTIGKQIGEALKIHKTLPSTAIKPKVLDLLKEVELKDIKSIYNKYPHQLSGGQLQRCMISLALANSPQVLMADEPTTALDPDVQQSIIALLRKLQKKHSMSMIFVSHDLDAVKNIADRILVMKDGYEKELGPAKQVFNSPKSQYAKALINCRPDESKKGLILPTVKDYLEKETVHLSPIKKPIFPDEVSLAVKGVELVYRQKKFLSKAQETPVLRGVSFEINKGEAVGLIGPSGCGKTSLGKVVAGWVSPTGGEVCLNSSLTVSPNKRAENKWFKQVQLIFQNPYSSLNPSIPIGNAIMEPMEVHGIASGKKAKKLAEELLEKVGLSKEHFKRYPHEFSGGQRQRIVIARALAVQPDVLVCDESVAALDVSVQAQVLNLLNQLRLDFNLSYLFISHDHNVVNYFCDRVLQMRDGKVYEEGVDPLPEEKKAAKPVVTKQKKEISSKDFRIQSEEEKSVEDLIERLKKEKQEKESKQKSVIKSGKKPTSKKVQDKEANSDINPEDFRVPAPETTQKVETPEINPEDFRLPIPEEKSKGNEVSSTEPNKKEIQPSKEKLTPQPEIAEKKEQPEENATELKETNPIEEIVDKEKPSKAPVEPKSKEAKKDKQKAEKQHKKTIAKEQPSEPAEEVKPPLPADSVPAESSSAELKEKKEKPNSPVELEGASEQPQPSLKEAEPKPTAFEIPKKTDIKPSPEVGEEKPASIEDTPQEKATVPFEIKTKKKDPPAPKKKPTSSLLSRVAEKVKDAPEKEQPAQTKEKQQPIPEKKTAGFKSFGEFLQSKK